MAGYLLAHNNGQVEYKQLYRMPENTGAADWCRCKEAQNRRAEQLIEPAPWYTKVPLQGNTL